MLTKPAQKLDSVEGHDLLAIVTVVAPSESYTVVVDGKQPVIRDGDLMGVPAEVFNHGGRTGKRLLGVDHPIRVPCRLDTV